MHSDLGQVRACLFLLGGRKPVVKRRFLRHVSFRDPYGQKLRSTKGSQRTSCNAHPGEASKLAQRDACPGLKMTVSDKTSYLLKPVPPLRLPFLSAEYHSSYFTKKIKAIKKEYSQAPSTLPTTHLPTGSGLLSC